MLVSKCLFPAAGYGTRFLPATKAMPKEMMPIVNRPLVEFGVEEASSAGMSKICIVTGRGKRAIEDHFDVSFELEHQILGSSSETYLTKNRALIQENTFSYTRQKAMKGLGDAVLTGRSLIGNEAFGVVLADDFCLNKGGETVMQQLASVAQEYETSVVAVMEVPVSQVSKYGIVSGEPISENLLRVTSLIEKRDTEAAPSNLAVIGRYILTNDIFEILSEIQPGANGEIQLTDALNVQAREGKVVAVRFKGVRFDCGSIEGFVEATNYYFEHYYVG